MNRSQLKASPAAARKTGPERTGFRRWATRPVFICLLLAGGTLAVYWPAGGFDFINYDDNDYVSENYHVLAGLTWRGVIWAFTTGHTGNWHPLTWLSHMADCQFFGARAGGPHLVNVLFHAANAVLLFLAMRQLTGALWRAATVAALFALHPLHVESVAWVSERKDVLSTFFGLLCLWCYARFVAAAKVPGGAAGGGRFYGLALACFLPALLAKPMLVTLPFLLLLLDYWPLGRFKTASRGPRSAVLRRLFLEKTPFLFLSAVFCVTTFVAQRKGGAVQSLSALPFAVRLENSLVSYVRYLEKVFWPFDLALPYPHPGAWPFGEVMLAAAILAVLCLAAIRLGRTRPYVLAGWLWFLGMLVPVIGLVQVGTQAMADRYMYLPAVGIFILLTWGAAEIFARLRLGKMVAGMVTIPILAACAWRTENQLGYWRNSGMLFGHAVAVTAGNDTAYTNLGNYCLEQGRWDEALANYHRALDFMRGRGGNDAITVTIGEADNVTLELDPLKGAAAAEILNNMGTALDHKGRIPEALQYYHAALRLNPEHALAMHNLGYELAARKQYPEAIAYYESVVRLRPDEPDSHNTLGSALVAAGRIDDAIRQYAEALRLSPNDAKTLNYLGLALAAQGHPAEAVVQYEAALRLDPKLIEVHNNLGSALVSLGRLEEAIQHFRLLLQWMPDHPRAHDNLGVALASQGKLDEAVAQLREAIRLEGTNANTHFNLGNVFALQRSYDGAARQFEETLRLAPDHVQAHCNLGGVRREQGRREDAIAEFREALRLDPRYSPAREQLRGLGVTIPP